MGTFLRKNIAFGVASTAAWVVGKKLWDLGSWALPLGDTAAVLLAGVAFLAGAAVFVWLYMFVNARLEDS
jgi:hypothetical protein